LAAAQMQDRQPLQGGAPLAGEAQLIQPQGLGHRALGDLPGLPRQLKVPQDRRSPSVSPLRQKPWSAEKKSRTSAKCIQIFKYGVSASQLTLCKPIKRTARLAKSFL